MNTVSASFPGAAVAGLAALAVVIFVAMNIFGMVVAWRSMKAIEKLAGSVKEADSAQVSASRSKA
jgi:hypothetical protein